MQEPFEQRVSRIQRRNPLTSILSDVGKLQPQAVEIEEAVLGALLIDSSGFLKVSDLLIADAFYKDEHKSIYAAISELFSESKPIDLLTVTNKLRELGKLEFAGGAFYISELTNRIATASNIEYHSLIILQKYIARRTIEMSSDLQRNLYDETSDVFEVLDQAKSDLLNIDKLLDIHGARHIGDVVLDANKEITKRAQSGKLLSGKSTGLRELDKILKGFNDSDLIICAARPGMGKTALALSIAIFMAICGIPIHFFSLEMSAIQLCLRMISIISEINGQLISVGAISEVQAPIFLDAMNKISSLPFWIDDNANQTIESLRSKAIRAKLENGCGLIVVDYLQLISATNKKIVREQQISNISRGLKILAKELNIPVLALAQLSRKTEERTGKTPQLSDLRESGSIEQDADQVLFIYRPEEYGIMEIEGMPTQGIAKIIVAKNRHGKTDTIETRFNPETSHFFNESPSIKNYSESNDGVPF